MATCSVVNNMCVHEDRDITCRFTDCQFNGGRKVYSMPMIGSCSSDALDGGGYSEKDRWQQSQPMV